MNLKSYLVVVGSVLVASSAWAQDTEYQDGNDLILAAPGGTAYQNGDDPLTRKEAVKQTKLDASLDVAALSDATTPMKVGTIDHAELGTLTVLCRPAKKGAVKCRAKDADGNVVVAGFRLKIDGVDAGP